MCVRVRVSVWWIVAGCAVGESIGVWDVLGEVSVRVSQVTTHLTDVHEGVQRVIDDINIVFQDTD